MKPDHERISMIQQALSASDLDALVCALPSDVLLLSGYCPVVGTSLAIVNRQGQVILIVPEDEKDLAAHGRADAVHAFSPASLENLQSASDAIVPILKDAAESLELKGARIGVEDAATTTPVPYAAIHLYSAEILRLVEQAIPEAKAVSAEDILKQLRSVKSSAEIERIRVACGIASEAFEDGAAELQEDKGEAEIASAFRRPLYAIKCDILNEHRADGFVHCMSGPNSARAFGAYARSRARTVRRGDLVLIHCNSYVDGFWTDVTRTYTLASPDDRQAAMYDAVFEARAAALAAIHPGAVAADVDRAARSVMERRGFAKAFKHPTGHGVGFAAINHNALPRLHPKSDDILQVGMVFNVEPAIYIEGYGGMRHCDMIALTQDGPDILTSFQSSASSLSF